MFRVSWPGELQDSAGVHKTVNAYHSRRFLRTVYQCTILNRYCVAVIYTYDWVNLFLCSSHSSVQHGFRVLLSKVSWLCSWDPLRLYINSARNKGYVKHKLNCIHRPTFNFKLRTLTSSHFVKWEYTKQERGSYILNGITEALPILQTITLIWNKLSSFQTIEAERLASIMIKGSQDSSS